jgi:hypothetical protein
MPDDARRDAAFYDHENEPRRHVVDWGADDLFTRMPRRRTVHTPPPPRARRPAPLDPLHRPGSEPPGRFERLDGEAPSAGDVLSSGRRFEPSARDDRAGEDPSDARRFTAAERRDRESGAPPTARRSASPDGGAVMGGTERDARVAGRAESIDETLDSSHEINEAAPVGDAGVARHATTAAARADTGTERRRDTGVSRPADDGAARWADAYVAPSSDGVTSDRWADAVGGRWSDAPGGRRTVMISGRPEGVARPRPERHRPPRTVAERLGPRPERIVAWAFALGLLLIIIAIATADAGHA